MVNNHLLSRFELEMTRFQCTEWWNHTVRVTHPFDHEFLIHKVSQGHIIFMCDKLRLYEIPGQDGRRERKGIGANDKLNVSQRFVEEALTGLPMSRSSFIISNLPPLSYNNGLIMSSTPNFAVQSSINSSQSSTNRPGHRVPRPPTRIIARWSLETCKASRVMVGLRDSSVDFESSSRVWKRELSSRTVSGGRLRGPWRATLAIYQFNSKNGREYAK